MPQRIQRRRDKGYRMPSGVIYVGRPTKFRNPYDVRRYGLKLAMEMFEHTVRGFWDPTVVPVDMAYRRVTVGWLYEAHIAWSKRIGGHPIEVIRAELRGKDLACWCPLTSKCHADVLLRIAND